MAKRSAAHRETVEGSVLLVDDELTDDDALLDSLRLMFSSKVTFTAAQSEDAARRIISDTKVDVLIVDWALKTKGEDEHGYELLMRLRNGNPRLEVLVATNYPTVENAVRCARAGCLGYLSKPIGATTLEPRIRQAFQLAGSGNRRAWHRETLILANWEMLQSATESEKKGLYLEWLVRLLFQSVPGWDRVEPRETTPTDEIDLLVSNRAHDRFWQNYGSALLVECKNWTARSPRKEFDALHMKVRRLGCRLGFFVTTAGVTKDFAMAASRKEDGILIVTLDSGDLWNLICSDDRNEWLVRHVLASLTR